jgi:preprotein translocase subunit SecG
MYGFLITVLVLDGLFLTTVILLQAGKGGGLAAMGGGAAATEGVLGGRQATTMLTRSTWTAGTIFMVLALVLAILSSRSAQPTSVLRQDADPTAPAAAQPLLPTGAAPAGGAATTGGGGDDSGNN